MWGDPDLTGANPLFDFNAAIELYRELLGALARQAGNIPNVRIDPAQWDQRTDDRRYGRMLLLPFAFAADISDEPWTVLPFSTAGGSGVQVHATVQVNFPDGTSTASGVLIAPP